MQFDKQDVIRALESLGNHEQAQQAQSQLPDQVDTDQHAGLLSNLGADVPQLVQHLSGGRL